jgi:hypothetical protein
MRTLSIVRMVAYLTVLSSAANAGMPVGNGTMLNGLSANGTTRLENGSLVNINNVQVLDAVLPNLDTSSMHLRKVVLSVNDIQLYGAVLSQRSGGRYRQ